MPGGLPPRRPSCPAPGLSDGAFAVTPGDPIGWFNDKSEAGAQANWQIVQPTSETSRPRLEGNSSGRGDLLGGQITFGARPGEGTGEGVGGLAPR